MSSILLTIAIPSYNGGNSLLEAVESCKNINLIYSEFEVLVVDNCSNDGSIDKLQNLNAKLSFLKIAKNEKNCGRVGNWNRCLEMAKGKFILFLFTNDLIAKKNHIKEALDLLIYNNECALINMPWIVSNYKMTDLSLPPQFFNRTPGYGYFDSAKHIKSVIETGKLPFVPLQSNLLRRSTVQKKGIKFDTGIPISSDGVFLSELAIHTGKVGFYDKPSVIWRYDAPGRLHSNINIKEHIKQVIKAFSVIKGLSKNSINITKSIANYGALEFFIASLIQIKTKKDLVFSWHLLLDWCQTLKVSDINTIQFITRIIWRLIKLPLKIKTFLYLVRK